LLFRVNFLVMALVYGVVLRVLMFVFTSACRRCFYPKVSLTVSALVFYVMVRACSFVVRVPMFVSFRLLVVDTMVFVVVMKSVLVLSLAAVVVLVSDSLMLCRDVISICPEAW